MEIKDWYLQRAYSILSDICPTSYDCGLLCKSKCCDGSSEDGMLLFPGEEKYFENSEGFVIKESQFGKTLICSGTCDRTRRPLSCRIFPLFPYVTLRDGKWHISVLKDVRALHYCPLDEEDVDSAFKRAVRLAARNLLRDHDCADFLIQLTTALTDVGNF